MAKVEAAAAKLVSERFLLPEDAKRMAEEAKQHDLSFQVAGPTTRMDLIMNRSK